jgi:hypothetical protein
MYSSTFYHVDIKYRKNPANILVAAIRWRLRGIVILQPVSLPGVTKPVPEEAKEAADRARFPNTKVSGQDREEVYEMLFEKVLARTVLGVLASLALSPMAVAMDKETYQFWEVVECPEGQVEVEGSVRFQYQETGKGWVLQAFWTGDGWGLDSGAEYLIRGKWMEVVNEKRPYVFYWNDHFELVGKAGAPTHRFYSRVRFDGFDNDGNPIPEFISAEWPCATIAYEMW